MNNKPVTLGVTGGIGAGKTMVCKIFSAMGVPVYDADSRAKLLMNSSANVRKQVIDAFGEAAYPEGQLNRAYLAEQVFNDSSKLDTLNGIVHPEVKNDFESWCLENADQKLLIKEAALLYETSGYQELSKLLLVIARPDLRIERVLKRDPQRDIEQVRGIIDKQADDAQKKKVADYIVENNGDSLILPQLIDIYKELTNRN